MNVTTIGIDLAKTVFSIHGTNQHGKVVVRKRLNRPKLLAFFAQLPPCLIGMEACSGAHYWARELTKLGHDARIIAPRFVAPYRKSSKNDDNDAEAICEAVGFADGLGIVVVILAALAIRCDKAGRNNPGIVAEFG